MILLLASYLGLWCLTVFVGLMAIGLMAEVKRLVVSSTSNSPLPLFWPAPSFTAVDVRKNALIDAASFRDAAHALLFVSPRCGTCHKLVRELEPTDCRLVILCRGDSAACAPFVEHAPKAVVLCADPDGEIASAYGASLTPMLFVIRDAAISGYGRPRSWQELRRLIAVGAGAAREPIN